MQILNNKFAKKLWASGNTWAIDASNTKKDTAYVYESTNGTQLKTTKEIDRMETLISSSLIRHLHSTPRIHVTASDVDGYIKDYEGIEGKRLNCNFQLSYYQKEAVKKAMQSQLMVLTGGPGTGKTCVIRGIVYAMERAMEQPDIIFLAPTGKAARRMEESVEKPATTVQKKIRLINEDSIPARIYADMIIIDECSMLDEPTMLSLVYAMEVGAKILFVGDTDQLPSVGFGAVLRDMISSAVIPVVKLEAPQRQKDGSNIYENICVLRKGYSYLTEGDDFTIIPGSDENGEQLLVQEYLRRVKEYGIDQTVVLTPYRRVGATCANAINKILQGHMNPPERVPHVKVRVVDEEDGEDEKPSTRIVTYSVGDPVMQLRNRNEVANGDVGKVIDVFKNGILVKFCDVQVFYELNELWQLDLAYAMSIHKSQGSEYKCVITCALPEHSGLLTRNLIYTAVTRAKKMCVMICDMDVVAEGIKREASCERITMLSEKIILEEEKRNLLVNAFQFAA